MRVIFMGSDKIAIPLLEVLKAKAEKLLVVSGVDKPVGRGHKVVPNEISAWALFNNVVLQRPEKLDDAFHSSIKEFAPDLIFVMAYGKILRGVLIDLPRLGTWNIHASALPYLRGASPIETAIALGEKFTAVALMRMVVALDAGPVGPSQTLEIGEKMTAVELRLEVGRISAALVAKNWSALTGGTILPLTQNESLATYCRILKKDDGWLDPSAPVKTLVDHIRAFAEWPGAAFVYAGERLKIYSARALSETSLQPAGTVVESAERLVISTGNGNLEILSLQRPGGKRLGVRDFLPGYPIKVGERFFGRPLRPLVDKKPFPRGF